MLEMRASNVGLFRVTLATFWLAHLHAKLELPKALEISLTRQSVFNLCADTTTPYTPSRSALSDRKYGRRKVHPKSDSPVEGLADNEGDDERSRGLHLRFEQSWTAR